MTNQLITHRLPIVSSKPSKINNNLSKEERNALTNLKKRSDAEWLNQQKTAQDLWWWITLGDQWML